MCVCVCAVCCVALYSFLSLNTATALVSADLFCVLCVYQYHMLSPYSFYFTLHVFLPCRCIYIYSRCCNLKKQLTFHSVVRYWRQRQSLTLRVLVCLVTAGLSPSFTRKSTPSGKRRSARHSKIDWLSSPSSGTLVALTTFCWTWTSTMRSWRFWMQVCTGCCQQ